MALLITRGLTSLFGLAVYFSQLNNMFAFAAYREEIAKLYCSQ